VFVVVKMLMWEATSLPPWRYHTAEGNGGIVRRRRPKPSSAPVHSPPCSAPSCLRFVCTGTLIALSHYSAIARPVTPLGNRAIVHSALLTSQKILQSSVDHGQPALMMLYASDRPTPLI
jgi:hypothetical protein